jgi:hypothetical protein
MAEPALQQTFLLATAVLAGKADWSATVATAVPAALPCLPIGPPLAALAVQVVPAGRLRAMGGMVGLAARQLRCPFKISTGPRRTAVREGKVATPRRARVAPVAMVATHRHKAVTPSWRPGLEQEGAAAAALWVAMVVMAEQRTPWSISPSSTGSNAPLAAMVALAGKGNPQTGLQVWAVRLAMPKRMISSTGWFLLGQQGKTALW